MAVKDDALKAVSAAEEVNKEAWLKINDVIGYRKARGMDVTDYVRMRTRALRRMQHFTELRHQLEAAGTAVKAPGVEEIQQVQALVQKVRDISVKDAASAAGLELAKDVRAALDKVNATLRGVETA